MNLAMKVCYRLSAAREELPEPAGGDTYVNSYGLSQLPPQVSQFRLTGCHSPSFGKTHSVREAPALPHKADGKVSHTCGQTAQHTCKDISSAKFSIQALQIKYVPEVTWGKQEF